MKSRPQGRPAERCRGAAAWPSRFEATWWQNGHVGLRPEPYQHRSMSRTRLTGQPFPIPRVIPRVTPRVRVVGAGRAGQTCGAAPAVGPTAGDCSKVARRVALLPHTHPEPEGTMDAQHVSDNVRDLAATFARQRP